MNPKADNIEKVIASIEAEPELFNMLEWEIELSCGTARCIGGWADHLGYGGNGSEEDAIEWLGISEDYIGRLFYGFGDSASLDDITKDMAIAALRDLQKDPVFKGWDHYVREDA